MKCTRILGLMCLLVAVGIIAVFAQQAWPGSFQKAYICGTVTLNGNPVEGVQVTAMGDGGMAMTRTAANGNYSLGVGAGKWSVQASKMGLAQEKSIQITMKPGEANEQVNITLKKFNSFIKGKVVTEAGVPLANAMVVAVNMPDMSSMNNDSSDDDYDEDSADMDGMGTPAYVTTDKNGFFTLSVKKGTHLLNANHANYEMSSKNPPAKLPGLPEGMAGTIKGVIVSIADGETRDGIVIIMGPVKAGTNKGNWDKGQADGTEMEPKPLVLIGRACLTPENVLHWTRTTDRDKFAGFVVKRSTVPFDSKEKGEVVEINLSEDFVGNLNERSTSGGKEAQVYSLTDTRAVPGKTYWYVVYEVGSKGRGPASNPVQLKTR